MRIVTLRAVLDIRCRMSRLAEVLRFVMAFNAGLQHRQNEEILVCAAVWRVATEALAVGDRTVADLIAEKARMTFTAGFRHQFSIHLHSIGRVVAALTLPLQHRAVNRGRCSAGPRKNHRLRRYIGRRISACLGVAMYPRDSAATATLMTQADQAMYAAKDSGKASYSLWRQLPTDRPQTAYR